MVYYSRHVSFLLVDSGTMVRLVDVQADFSLRLTHSKDDSNAFVNITRISKFLTEYSAIYRQKTDIKSIAT